MLGFFAVRAGQELGWIFFSQAGEKSSLVLGFFAARAGQELGWILFSRAGEKSSLVLGFLAYEKQIQPKPARKKRARQALPGRPEILEGILKELGFP